MNHPLTRVLRSIKNNAPDEQLDALLVEAANSAGGEDPPPSPLPETADVSPERRQLFSAVADLARNPLEPPLIRSVLRQLAWQRLSGPR